MPERDARVRRTGPAGEGAGSRGAEVGGGCGFTGGRQRASESLTEEPAFPGNAEAACEGPQPRDRGRGRGGGASPGPQVSPGSQAQRPRGSLPPGVGAGGLHHRIQLSKSLATDPALTLWPVSPPRGGGGPGVPPDSEQALLPSAPFPGSFPKASL